MTGTPDPPCAKRFRERLTGTRAAIDAVEAQLETIVAIASAMRDAVAAGGTIVTCGNGGSAAEALHLAEELTGRYRSSRDPVAALCLSADPTALTCIANDFGFDEVFARPARALLRPADVLVVFSTSGQSANVLRVLQVARERGAATVGLLGKDGGPALALCDRAVVIPLDDSAHIQEAHQVIMHLLCETWEA